MSRPLFGFDMLVPGTAASELPKSGPVDDEPASAPAAARDPVLPDLALALELPARLTLESPELHPNITHTAKESGTSGR
jgi:hypothetical protein